MGKLTFTVTLVCAVVGQLNSAYATEQTATSGQFTCAYVNQYEINPATQLNKMSCDTNKTYTITHNETADGQYLVCCITK